MSKLEAIEKEILGLPREQALALQDWLSEYLEDKLELNPDFLASIERGKAELQQENQIVAKVVPAKPMATPDFLARAKAVWGDNPEGKPLSTVVSEGRGNGS